MDVLIDSCTLILLAKASVLETLAALRVVHVPKGVYREVLAGKKHLFPDALLVERLSNEKKLVMCSVSKTAARKIATDFNMGIGEASVIVGALAHSGWCVATDNRQGRSAAKIFNLPLIGSIEIVVHLWKQKKIDTEKARQALSILKHEGWFNPYLIEKAGEDIHG